MPWPAILAAYAAGKGIHYSTWMAKIAANRMISIFKRGADGKRPCFGPTRNFRRTLSGTSAVYSTSTIMVITEWALGASHKPAGADW